MLARLFLLFTLVPVVEIALLAWIASRTSLAAVLALVVGTGILALGWRGDKDFKRSAAYRPISRPDERPPRQWSTGSWFSSRPCCSWCPAC